MGVLTAGLGTAALLTSGCGATSDSFVKSDDLALGRVVIYRNGIAYYERRATIVTTNLAFAEWVTVFAGDEKLTTALLDRLAHHATVITTKGKSYRMRKRRPREDPA